MIAFVLPPTIQTASIGIPDTMFLMVLALIVFGPRRLPEIGRQIGKLMYEFRKVSNDFKFQMEEELRASEEADRQQKLAAASSAPLMIEAAPQPELAPEPAALDFVAPAPGINSLEEPPSAEPLSSSGSHPVFAPAPSGSAPSDPAKSMLAEPGPAVEAAAEPSLAPAVAGEVRGEPRKFPPTIQPPSGGEPVAAARPFRSRVESDAPDVPVSPADLAAETVTDSGADPDQPTGTSDKTILSSSAIASVAVDEGRIGTEVQPGVPGRQRTVDSGASIPEAEREARHA